jgi:hypothetical protein
MHTYGLSLLTTDRNTAENFLYNQAIPLCKEFKCNYFIQGLDLRDYGISWVFVEFFGEGNQDTILKVIEEFNKKFGYAYYDDQILMNEPTREFLVKIGLFK